MSALKIKDAQGNWIEVPMIKGDKGDKGDTYELTQQDKEDIAELVEIPEPLKYIKDDPSDNGGVIEGFVNGNSTNVASGRYSHAEGGGTKAIGDYSHAEGVGTQANNTQSHSEGYNTIASGTTSHSEGYFSVASGITSHTEGAYTVASGAYGHTEGLGTIANHRSQHVFGEYNIEDDSLSTASNRGNYVEIVGNGDYNNRSNAYTLDWNGNGVYAGKVTVGSAPTNDMDVATKKYVDDVKGASIHICSSEEYDSTTRIPTIQNPDERTFYLVPSEDGTSPDLFVEWAYVNNNWEMFGSASIDLSGYLTDVQINGTSVVTDGVANVPILSQSQLGVAKINTAYGTGVLQGGVIGVHKATSSDIKTGTHYYRPIVPISQHEATFYGLAKASGDETQSASSNAVGTYTDEAKASIQNMLGVPSVNDIPEVPVEDVQINGTSIIQNGVANIPLARKNTLGAVALDSGKYGLQYIDADYNIGVSIASSANIKQGALTNVLLAPKNQHEAVFFGLSKVAGVDLINDTVTTGQYTPEAKGAIQSMLGIDLLIAPTETNPFSDAHAIGDLFIINGALYKAKTAIAVGDVLDDGVNVDGVSVDDVAVKDVQINGTSILNNGVANVPVAGIDTLGAIKMTDSVYSGLRIVNGYIATAPKGLTTVKGGLNSACPIVPQSQHWATFYGLAKASGDTTQSISDNAVGTYTDEAKASIQTMLGVPSSDDVVSDVQIDGTSIVTDGVANVPIASATVLGVLKPDNGSLAINTNNVGQLIIRDRPLAYYKGANPNTAVVCSSQHIATFYGLAKASGDTTQSQSDNAVGTYTDEAKQSIKQMLGVVDSYDSLVVNVTGTDPVITAQPSYRYNCGEVTTLTITPPSSGTIDIIFTSGTTPTVLDLPSTVKMPSWWIGVEANTTYEMCITDGVYCGVMSWDA